MSLELLAAGLAGGLLGGYFALRRWLSRQKPKVGTESALLAATERASASELQVGDVVGIATREYWLTSGYSLSEAGHALAAVFSAEEARLVLTLGAQGALYLGQPVSLVLPSELPARLEHLDQSFSLKSRLPVEVITLGREAKSAATAQPIETAQWGRYEGGSEQTLWVLRTPESTHAILSRRVPETDIFRWGSADST